MLHFCCFAQKHSDGVSDSVLPKSLTRKTSVRCLLSKKDNQHYKDHLCLNRALAMYMNGHRYLDSITSRNITKICSKSGHDPKIFLANLRWRFTSCRRNDRMQHLSLYTVFIDKRDITWENRPVKIFECLTKQSNFCNSTSKFFKIDTDSFFNCFRCPSGDGFFNLLNNFTDFF